MQPEQTPGESLWLDRRQEHRHELERACRVARAGTPQAEMNGITTNVSRSGMLVRFPEAALSEAMPQVGEFARICIDLPADTAYSPRSLECAARVVRAPGKPGGEPELAFGIHSMKIRTRKASAGSRRGKNSALVQ